MALEITQHEANGICILALKGRLVLGDESMGYRATVNKLLSSGTKRIVINLEQARYIDSAGLGALIETHRTAKEKGGRLTLCSLGPNFRQALEYAKLLQVFETFSNQAAAVESFGAPSSKVVAGGEAEGSESERERSGDPSSQAGLKSRQGSSLRSE